MDSENVENADKALEDLANEGDAPEETQPKHEFEIIVAHANVIRYFLCRYV